MCLPFNSSCSVSLSVSFPQLLIALTVKLYFTPNRTVWFHSLSPSPTSHSVASTLPQGRAGLDVTTTREMLSPSTFQRRTTEAVLADVREMFPSLMLKRFDFGGPSIHKRVIKYLHKLLLSTYTCKQPTNNSKTSVSTLR